MLAVVLVEIRSVPAERSRHNPRVVKRKMSGFPAGRPRPAAAGFATTSTSKSCRPPCRKWSIASRRHRSHPLTQLPRPLRISQSRKVRRSRIASTMSGLGASADCPAPIIAGRGVSICEPLINGSPVSVIYSAARCGTTNYSLNDTVLRLTLQLRVPFEVGFLGHGLMAAAPDGPGDDESRFDPALGQTPGNTTDLLE
jgi:hypothetical protein